MNYSILVLEFDYHNARSVEAGCAILYVMALSAGGITAHLKNITPLWCFHNACGQVCTMQILFNVKMWKILGFFTFRTLKDVLDLITIMCFINVTFIYNDFLFVNMKSTKVCYIIYNACVYFVEEITLSVSFDLRC